MNWKAICGSGTLKSDTGSADGSPVSSRKAETANQGCLRSTYSLKATRQSRDSRRGFTRPSPAVLVFGRLTGHTLLSSIAFFPPSKAMLPPHGLDEMKDGVPDSVNVPPLPRHSSQVSSITSTRPKDCVRSIVRPDP